MKKSFPYVGEGPQFLDFRRRSGTRSVRRALGVVEGAMQLVILQESESVLRRCGWVVFGLVQRDDAAFSLLVVMCPFSTLLVLYRVYASELFNLRARPNVPP